MMWHFFVSRDFTKTIHLPFRRVILAQSQQVFVVRALLHPVPVMIPSSVLPVVPALDKPQQILITRQ